jgi:magnesium chelatase family protein
MGPSGKKATHQCKCGYLGDPQQGCSRQPRCAEDYQSRISGPLFDRIDLHVEVPAVSPSDLSLPPPAEDSAEVAARVAMARGRQTERFASVNAELAGNGSGSVVEAGLAGRIVRTNGEADGELLEQIAAPDAEGRKLLTTAAEKFKLSARGYHRVLRVARTLADLDGAPAVRRPHIAEALSYRRIQLRG